MKITSLIISTLCLLCTYAVDLGAQGGYHFGIKAGPTLANQTWNEGERRMLFAYHGNVFVESRDPNDRGSLYAQLGMHTRGSSIRLLTLGSSVDNGYKFQNISLQVGAKKNVSSSLNFQPYYFAGIRGEYNVSNNLLDIIERYCTGNTQIVCNFPDPVFINKITYGITIGGGLILSESEFFSPTIEFSFSPDMSYQYQQPSLGNIPNPNGGTTTLGERQIRNVSFEVSLVLKFLREVIYTD